MTDIPYIDIHTHRICNTPNTIEVLNILPDEEYEHAASCGLHPWNVNNEWEKTMSAIEKKSGRANIIFIGEAGIDKICGKDLQMQMQAMENQAIIAEKAGKPMIIHCVKGYDEIISIKKDIRPAHKWIIHGFRGKPQLAMQLLGQGCDISFGEKFNQETVKAIPLEHIWAETDESIYDISNIYEAIAKAKGISIEELKKSIYERFCGLCPYFRGEEAQNF